MYDIVPWFGEVVAALLAIMILIFATLLCVARSRAYASEVQATSLVPSPADNVLNLKILSTELVTVINWFLLGINLGLPKHELSKIISAELCASRERPTKGGDVISLAATYTKRNMGGCGESSSTDGGERSSREHT